MKQHGFSLIELSVVLILIGIAVGGLLSIAIQRLETAKIRSTEETLTKIEQALSAYIAQHQKLPCPADASLAPSAANFGRSTRNGTAGSEDECSGTPPQWYSNATYPSWELGSVPTKELQIADELAFDAWGNRITYGMIEHCNASYTEKASSNFSNDSTCGNDSANTSVTIRGFGGTTITTEAILLLISHGANGHGAWKHNGSTTRINAYNGALIDSDELENSDLLSNGSNQAHNRIYIQKSKTATFDDIVRFKTKTHLIQESGALKGRSTTGVTDLSTLHPLCSLVINTITNSTDADNLCGTDPGNSSCSTSLTTLASQIRSLCF